MLAQQAASFMSRRGLYYGWVIVAVTFLVMLATAASVGMPGVLIRPLQIEYGWTVSEISGPLALRLMLFGALAPFAAAFMNRYGIRAVVLTALALIVAGLGVALLGMHSLWQLWALWGGVVGLGTGLTALVLGATIANRWFSARRGLVIGLLTASSATGQLAFLPVAAWLAENYGWRVALAPALVACVVAAVLVVLLMCDRPASVGLLPYGEVGKPVTAAAPVTAAGSPFRAAVGALTEAARLPVFWILFGTFFICGLSTNGLIQTHFVPFCSDFGLPQVQAASFLAVMGVFDFIGTIASGWLSDRYDGRKLLFWYYGLRGISLVFLPYSSFTLYGLSLFAVFYGLDWIATVPPTVRVAGAAFGREKAPTVFGWVFMGHQVGAAVAAYGAGWSRDTLSTYLPAFFGAGVACFAAAIACLAIKRAAPLAPQRSS